MAQDAIDSGRGTTDTGTHRGVRPRRSGRWIVRCQDFSRNGAVEPREARTGARARIRAGVVDARVRRSDRAAPETFAGRLRHHRRDASCASPSAGDLRSTRPTSTGACRRTRTAAPCAVSVLTEPSRFGGSLEHLAQTARTLAPLGVPVMRKDFLVDPYQVMEARAAGAGGVLVIVRMLDRSRIKALLDVRGDAEDVRADRSVRRGRPAGRARSARRAQGARRADARRRELPRSRRRCSVDLARLGELASHLPPDFASVAESGVGSLDDVKTVVDVGYDLALVGTTLMSSADPRQAARRDARGRPRARDGSAHAQDANRNRRRDGRRVAAWRSG